MAKNAPNAARGASNTDTQITAASTLRINRNVPDLSRDDMISLARTMLLIRRFETRVEELFKLGIIKGTAHSSAGQEAIAAGA